MIAIGVRLLHGWARAAGGNDGALMGSIGHDAAEWPLSPARLFAALVAAGGTGNHRRVPGDDSELRSLEGAGAPVIVADRREHVMLTPLMERFVVVNERKVGAVQNYPARVSAVSRPGVRLAPKNPELTYVWPDLHLTDGQLDALRARLARVGYLGAADAPAHLSLCTDVPTGDTWMPDPAGDAYVAVAEDGFLDLLDASYEDFIAGSPVTGSSIRRPLVAYRSPDAAPEATDRPCPVDDVTLLWFRLDKSVSGHQVVHLAEAARRRALAAFGERGTPGEAPAALHGHGLPRGAPRIRFWPLPFVGRYGNGRIHGLCVVIPRSFPRSDLQRISAALADTRISLSGGTERHLRRFAGEPRPWSAHPRRWRQASRVWVSATPVVFEQYRKRGPSAHDVAQWCEHAGVPNPAAFEISRTPLIDGAVDLRPHQTVRKKARPYPYGHVRLWFDEPVEGPFALGRMRSFGLGLMAPQEESAEVGLSPDPSVEEGS